MAWQQLSSFNPSTGFSLNEEDINDLYEIVGNQLIRRDGTKTMLGNLSMNSFNINGLLDPTQPNDAATKAYTDSKANVSGQIFTGNIGMNQNWINNVGNAIQDFDVINKITNDTLLNGKLSLSGGTMTGTLTMNSQVLKGNPGIICQGYSVGEGLVNFYNTAHGVGRVGTSADVYFYTTSGALDLSTNGTTRNQFRIIGTSCLMNLNLDMYQRFISNMAYIQTSTAPIITGTSTTSVIIQGSSNANGGIGLGNQNHGICRGSVTQGSNNDIVVYTAGTGSKIYLSPSGNSTAYWELSTTLLNCKVTMDMYNNKISNLGTPTANSDAATKLYVDNLNSGITGNITILQGNIVTINNDLGTKVPYTGAAFDVNLNTRNLTNVNVLSINRVLGLTPYNPIGLTTSSLFISGTSDKLVYCDSVGGQGNVCTTNGFTMYGNIELDSTRLYANGNIQMGNSIIYSNGAVAVDQNRFLFCDSIRQRGTTSFRINDYLNNNLMIYYNSTNDLNFLVPTALTGYGLTAGYTYSATIDSNNTTGSVTRIFNVISIDTATASKFLSRITYTGNLLPYQRFMLRNNTSFNITLGHKCVTSAGYLLGLFKQLTPDEFVEIVYDTVNDCFELLNRNTNNFEWNIVPVREAEFKGFRHNNGAGAHCGINANNSITTINGMTFSIWTSGTTTGTNWSISTSGTIISFGGDGNMSSGDTELYKTRYFNYNFTSSTITISGLTQNSYYIICFLANDFDNTTVRTVQLDLSSFNKRITYNYQGFYTGFGYTNPACIAYLVFRATNSTTMSFLLTNVSNFHSYAIWVLKLSPL